MFIIGVRLIANNIGIDPWDVDLTKVRLFARKNEKAPTSRFWFGSPCRFVRNIDFIVHVLLPEMIAEKHPTWATYLRSTSPRWGRSWRTWEVN